jgi:type I restriction enzyme S subunit
LNYQLAGKMNTLFPTGKPAPDQTYLAIRDSHDPYYVAAREWTDRLWQDYSPYADVEFSTEIRNSFAARFWEMYLACTLLALDLPIRKIRPGPDVLLEFADRRTWLEARAPTAGDQSLPDSVPPIRYDRPQPVPHDQIILRLTGAIRDKYMVDYPHYREQGIVGEGDSYVVAINACRIPFAFAEDNPPRILKAVLPIGCQQITVDLATGESKADTFVPRNLIGKNQGEGVNTDLFLSEDHRALSAVLYSRADALKWKNYTILNRGA